MRARAPSRRPWRSLPWWWCSCCAWPGLPPCPCRCAASTPHVKRPGWRRAATSATPWQRRDGSHHRARRSSWKMTAAIWSLPSGPVQSCCLLWTLLPERCRPRSRDDRGAATVVAAAAVAVLLFVTAAGVYLGSVVAARHRAQAAADLGALAGAAALPQGVSVACARATSVVRQMRVRAVECVVQDLDVVVSVEVAVPAVGVARAAARAGPVDGPQRNGPGTRRTGRG